MIDSPIMHKFNVHIVGNGSQTLVMGHGFGSDQTALRYHVQTLGSQYRIVLFVYLGCGQADNSNYNPNYYNRIECYANNVLEIYDALNLIDTVFIPHLSAPDEVLVAIQQFLPETTI